MPGVVFRCVLVAALQDYFFFLISPEDLVYTTTLPCTNLISSSTSWVAHAHLRRRHFLGLFE